MENKMLSIRDGEALDRALRSDIDHHIKRLLRLRSQQLGDIADKAHFAVVQPGDAPADLERAIGFSVFRNPADGSHLGEPQFTPGWEWIEDHGFAWEMCFIFTDDGFAHVVIIPRQNGVDAELQKFCAQHAREHA